MTCPPVVLVVWSPNHFYFTTGGLFFYYKIFCLPPVELGVFSCLFGAKKTPAGLKESLAGVRFVTAVGCKTGWERTMPRLDGVVAVIDANVHVFSSLSFSLRFADLCKRLVDNFSSQPVNLYQGERCGEGEKQKPPGSGIARNRAAKNGRTCPMLFYLLIYTNSTAQNFFHCIVKVICTTFWYKPLLNPSINLFFYQHLTLFPFFPLPNLPLYPIDRGSRYFPVEANPFKQIFALAILS